MNLGRKRRTLFFRVSDSERVSILNLLAEVVWESLFAGKRTTDKWEAIGMKQIRP